MMPARDTAGGVVRGPDGKIVLVWQNQNSWSFPKGGIDDGEDELEAAKREIWEETGLKDLEFVSRLGSYQRRSIGLDGSGEDTSRPPSTKTLFLFKTSQEVLVPQEKDVVEARWVTVDEALLMLTHPKDREFLDSVRDTIENYDAS